ncbi:MAG: response regulator [Cyanobacteria bacterium J06598_1]
MKHISNLLAQLEQLNDGELRLTSKSGQWRFYMLDGQLLYASGQALAVRRFHRAAYYHRANWKWGVDPAWSEDKQAWEVLLLERAIAHSQLSPIQVKLILRMVLGECLFELLHDGTVTASEWLPYHLETSSTYRSAALSLLEVKRIVGKTERLVETWTEGALGYIHLSSAPIFPAEHPPAGGGDSAGPLAAISPYLQGHHSLWDLFLNQVPSLDRLASLLWPLAKTGKLKFKSLLDLPLPVASESNQARAISIPASQENDQPRNTPATAQSSAPGAKPTVQAPSQPALIACIDDSPVLTLALKKILTSAGYKTLSIPEPMRGFSKLIEHRPNLILLDLMLPNADGYSICKFLRETPAFAKTPIIILTGQDTNLDRMRARLAGATEFLAKPPQAEALVEMIERHLKQVA